MCLAHTVSLAGSGSSICGVSAADRRALLAHEQPWLSLCPAGEQGAHMGPGPHTPPSSRHLSQSSLTWVSNLRGCRGSVCLLKDRNKIVTSTFLKDQMEIYFLASAWPTSPCSGLCRPPHGSSNTPVLLPPQDLCTCHPLGLAHTSALEPSRSHPHFVLVSANTAFLTTLASTFHPYPAF